MKKLKQEDLHFQVSLEHIVRIHLKTTVKSIVLSPSSVGAFSVPVRWAGVGLFLLIFFFFRLTDMMQGGVEWEPSPVARK